MAPYSVESPWSAAANAAGAYLAGAEQKRQYLAEQERQKREDAYKQAIAQQGAERLRLEAQAGEREQKKFGEEEADRARALTRQQAIDALNKHIAGTPIPRPKNYARMSPADQATYMADYLRKRLAQQQGLGDEEGVRATAGQIAQYDTEANDARRQEAEIQRQAINIAAEARRQGLQISAEDAREAAREQAEAARESQREGAESARLTQSEQFQEAQQGRLFRQQDALAANRAKTKPPTVDPTHVREWSTVMSNPVLKATLSPKLLNQIQIGVYAYGLQGTIQHLQSAATGKANIPGMTKEEAAQAASALTSGIGQ
jgi:hypothetical protein